MSGIEDQIAEEARALLARRRVSGRQIRERLGWSSAYLSRRLNGHTAFAISDLEELASMLNIPVTRLLPRSEDGFELSSGEGVIILGEWFSRRSLAASVRCGYCHRPIFLTRIGDWYHVHNGSVACYPGSGSGKKAFPGGRPVTLGEWFSRRSLAVAA